jgi:hypothetical protein
MKPLTTKAGIYCTMRVSRNRPNKNQQAANRRVDTAYATMMVLISTCSS